MALIHNVSDAIHMRIDKDKVGNQVIEMEFQYIRYRLVIDDVVKGKKLMELLDLILKPEKQQKGEKMKLPKFYKKPEK